MAVNRDRIVCFDKDGTLVVNDPYNVDPRRIRPAPGASRALRTLAAAGYGIAVVTNQRGVALGRFPAAALQGVRAWLESYCASAGVELQGFYVCPHAGGCVCRKPSPGLIAAALADLDADPSKSWMVGDILDDVEAGTRAGCRTVLVDSGNETQWVAGPYRNPTVVASSLPAAATAIVEAAS